MKPDSALRQVAGDPPSTLPFVRVAILLVALGGAWLGCDAGDPAAVDLKPSALGLEQIVEQYAAALGGRERLAALRSVVKKGRFSNRGGPRPSDNVPIEVAIVRPDRYARRMEFEDGNIVQAVDGDQVWQLFPPLDIDVPTAMPAVEAARFRRRIDVEGALLDWQAKGHVAQLLGQGEVAGRAVYAVRIEFADGEMTTLYLDAGTFLPFREYERTQGSRGWVEAEITYDDYREVGGILWPFSEVTRLSVSEAVQTTLWNEIAVDVELPAETFAMP